MTFPQMGDVTIDRATCHVAFKSPTLSFLWNRTRTYDLEFRGRNKIVGKVRESGDLLAGGIQPEYRTTSVYRTDPSAKVFSGVEILVSDPVVDNNALSVLLQIGEGPLRGVYSGKGMRTFGGSREGMLINFTSPKGMTVFDVRYGDGTDTLTGAFFGPDGKQVGPEYVLKKGPSFWDTHNWEDYQTKKGAPEKKAAPAPETPKNPPSPTAPKAPSP